MKKIMIKNIELHLLILTITTKIITNCNIITIAIVVVWKETEEQPIL